MKLIIYDTFEEYVGSGSNKKDDLCYIKSLNAWYQGGHVKDKKRPGTPKPPVGCGCPPPPCGCPEPKPEEPPFIHPETCEDECSCSCHHHCPPPLSVVDVGGIKYWTWEGRLLVDCEGNFIPVSGETIPWDQITAYIDARIPSDYDARLAAIERRLTAIEAALINKADKFTLKTLTVNGVETSLFGNGTIEICSDCQPGPTPTSYRVTNDLTNCTTNNYNTSAQEGSRYYAVISPNFGYEMSSISCTMNGSPVSVSNYVVDIASVTGNIVIKASASAIPVTSYNITKHATNCTISGPDSVNAGASFNGSISVPSGYHIISSYYMMNGSRVEISGTSIYIPSVIANVDIHVIAEPNTPGPTDQFRIYYALTNKENDFSLPANAGSYLTSSVVTSNTVDFTVTFTEVPVWVRLWIPADKGDVSGYTLAQFCNQPLITNSYLFKVGSVTKDSVIYNVYDACRSTGDPMRHTRDYIIGASDPCKIKQ